MSQQLSILRFTSVFIGARLFGVDPVFAMCTEQLSNHTRHSLTGRVRGIFDNFEEEKKKDFGNEWSLWKKKHFLRSATCFVKPYRHYTLFVLFCFLLQLGYKWRLGGKSIVEILKTIQTFSPVFTRCNVYKTGDWLFSNTSLRYKVLHSKSFVLMFLL